MEGERPREPRCHARVAEIGDTAKEFIVSGLNRLLEEVSKLLEA